MKRLIKSLLHRLGLGRTSERVYFNLKTLTPRVLVEEVRVRLFQSEATPVPPGRLIYDVIACRWAHVYLTSGSLLARDLLKTLDSVGYQPQRTDRILDFGCGCGRLTRHLVRETDAEIFGTDYNPALIAWCKANLPRASFSRNNLAPPLSYGAATFDLVIARSVFTHLTEDMMRRWLAEMARVIRPGGLFYFSMHGPLLASSLPASQRKAVDAGELIVTYSESEGENLCSSFASPEFVRRRLVRGFELVRYQPGRPVKHLRQDVYVMRRTGA